MPDILDHGHLFDKNRWDKSENHGPGAECTYGEDKKDSIPDQAPQVDQGQETSKKHEKVCRRIGDKPARVKGAVVDVVEQTDEQPRLDLVGMDGFLVRHVSL